MIAKSLVDVLTKNKSNFKRDLRTLFALEPKFTNQPVVYNEGGLDRSFAFDFDIQKITSNGVFHFTIDGVITDDQHHTKRVPVIETTIQNDGTCEFDIVQDEDLQGNPIKITSKIHIPSTTDEYQKVRNDLFKEFHHNVYEKYREKPVGLIRKFLKQ